MRAPYFLAALPKMQDETFSRAVILITRHEKDSGAMGLILNKRLVDEDDGDTQMVAEVKDPEGNTIREFQSSIYMGGPVKEENLFALHEIAAVGKKENQITENLFLASDPDSFQQVLEEDAKKTGRRFFLGCTSWDEGQLESELRSGSWLCVPFDKKFIFEESTEENAATWMEDLWKRVIQHGGADPLTLTSQGDQDFGYN